MNFANARTRMACSRCVSVNCSAVDFREARNRARFVKTACMAACLGCVLFVRIGEPREECPPVVNECHHPCCESTALQVLGRESTPAPLIFEFVEIVLGIRAVAIDLRKRQDLMGC